MACGMLVHSSSMAVRSCWILAGSGTRCRICRSRASQTCSMGDMSGEYAPPDRVPLLSAKNKKRMLQFAQTHQNWTIEDCKIVAWSNESRFLLRHSDGGVRIWRKEHESMDPSCLVSTVQAGGVMVWGYFLGKLWAS